MRAWARGRGPSSGATTMARSSQATSSCTPHWLLRNFWDVTHVFIMVYIAVWVPVAWGFRVEGDVWAVAYVVDILLMLDVPVNLRTGASQ